MIDVTLIWVRQCGSSRLTCCSLHTHQPAAHRQNHSACPPHALRARYPRGLGEVSGLRLGIRLHDADPKSPENQTKPPPMPRKQALGCTKHYHRVLITNTWKLSLAAPFVLGRLGRFNVKRCQFRTDIALSRSLARSIKARILAGALRPSICTR